MKPLLRSLTSLTLGIASVAAVAAADIPIAHTVQSDPLTGISIAIRNKANSPITALLVETRQYTDEKLRGGSVRYFDTEVNWGHDKPILPNQVHVLQLVDPDRIASGRFEVSPDVSVVFADGSTFGREEGIRVLLGRRRLVRDDLRAVADLLDQWSRTQLPQQEILARLGALIDTKAHFLSSSSADQAIKLAGTFVPVTARAEMSAVGTMCNAGCVSTKGRSMARVFRVWADRLDRVHGVGSGTDAF